MIDRQRGALSLFKVALGSAVLAAVAMAALYSMRHERNLFAEGTDKLGQMVKNAPGAASLDTSAPLKKCVIGGKTVVSNTECADANPTSKTIDIVDTRGIEAPKAPPVTEQAPTSDPALDKILEKQLH